jgi:hypothetical protein
MAGTGSRRTDKRRFSETQDTGLLLHVLQDIWEQVRR